MCNSAHCGNDQVTPLESGKCDIYVFVRDDISGQIIHVDVAFSRGLVRIVPSFGEDGNMVAADFEPIPNRLGQLHEHDDNSVYSLGPSRTTARIGSARHGPGRRNNCPAPNR